MRRWNAMLLIVTLAWFWLAPAQWVQAKEEAYGDAYTVIGEAIMSTKDGKWEETEQSLSHFAQLWQQIDKPGQSEDGYELVQEVDQALDEVQQGIAARQTDDTLVHLRALSTVFLAFDEMMHPIDEAALRESFGQVLLPALETLKTAIETQDSDTINAAYKKVSTAWTKKESIVRSVDMNMYGQIETAMGILRISLAKEQQNAAEMTERFDKLNVLVNQFVDNTASSEPAATGNYSIKTLVELLQQAEQSVADGDPQAAVAFLEQFLTVWPNAEGEVSTRSSSLYRALEADIPLIAGQLSSSNTELDKLKTKLGEYVSQLQLLQGKSYTFWDAALVMLREGLEALLIVSALLALLKRSGQQRYQKWIWTGALLGLVASIAIAFLISAIFNSATAGANREIIEGVTGIVAVLMIIGVGSWLHQKSRLQGWNRYMNKQIGEALSTGSVLSMAFVSFLAIFREGAETIIFYTGMVSSISVQELMTGIVIALLILAVFAFVFVRYSAKLPLGPFFKIATVLLYVLAFKMVGTSLHALQLTKVISTTPIPGLPVMAAIGLYPTWETILAQLLLVIIIATTVILIEKRQKG